MNRSVSVAVAALLLCCSGRPNDEMSVGTASAALGREATRILWHDATGAVVPVVNIGPGLTDGAPPRVFFLHEHSVWVYEFGSSPSTGGFEYRVVPVQDSSNVVTYYLSDDCTGPKYIQTYLGPTLGASTVTLDGQSYYRFANDVATVQRSDLHSVGIGDVCVPGTYAVAVVPFASLTRVTKPAQPFVPPLHPEVHPDVGR